MSVCTCIAVGSFPPGQQTVTPRSVTHPMTCFVHRHQGSACETDLWWPWWRQTKVSHYSSKNTILVQAMVRCTRSNFQLCFNIRHFNDTFLEFVSNSTRAKILQTLRRNFQPPWRWVTSCHVNYLLVHLGSCLAHGWKRRKGSTWYGLKLIAGVSVRVANGHGWSVNGSKSVAYNLKGHHEVWAALLCFHVKMFRDLWFLTTLDILPGYHYTRARISLGTSQHRLSTDQVVLLIWSSASESRWHCLRMHKKNAHTIFHLVFFFHHESFAQTLYSYV